MGDGGSLAAPGTAAVPASGDDTSPRKERSREPVVDRAVQELHARCGVYTKPEIVNEILDAVGWTSGADLAETRLLEPAAGNGAFLVAAAERLIASFRRRDIDPKAAQLVDRISAFEIHPAAAGEARMRVWKTLLKSGLHHRTATACVNAWIADEDFLMAEPGNWNFTHAVGNPPYIRWSKIPEPLKSRYAARLPGKVTGGDLFLPFLDMALDFLEVGGRCGFLCSDRWRFMAFGQAFRDKWTPRLKIISERSIDAAEAFATGVDAYPSILVASKRAEKRKASAGARRRTLADANCLIRVGPALGHTPAFVLRPEENDVEQELLRPWIDGSEISEGRVTWRGRRVVAMHDDDGRLIDLDRFPLLAARLERFKTKLENRSIVRNGAAWYRTIDRTLAVDWARPKLVLPELAKVPRLAVDRSGAIPSHGVYAIFAPDDDVDELYGRLKDGGLERALVGIAPKIKGGYIRCYRRFLATVPLDS